MNGALSITLCMFCILALSCFDSTGETSKTETEKIEAACDSSCNGGGNAYCFTGDIEYYNQCMEDCLDYVNEISIKAHQCLDPVLTLEECYGTVPCKTKGTVYDYCSDEITDFGQCLDNAGLSY